MFLLLFACQTPEEPTLSLIPAGPLVPEHPSPVLGPPQRSNTGLEWWILEHGTGEKPKKGSQVEIQYVGWREDGRRFDSSFSQGQNFVFRLGYGQVMRAWDEAVADMQVGERRQLKVPPWLGLANRGSVNATEILIYELKLLVVR